MQPPRRSARFKERPAPHENNPTEPDTQPLAEDEDEDYQSPAVSNNKENVPKKRNRKTTAPSKSGNNTNKRRRVGRLQNLPEMPIDILFEIFGHLTPYDLLRLSRTTKALRVILMRRSSAFVWKRTRDNVPDLPSCPPQLAEPAYANLAFDPYCHSCGARGARADSMDWFFFKRFCRRCAKKTYTWSDFEDVNDLLDAFPVLETHPQWVREIELECLPLYSQSTFLESELTATLLAYAKITNEEQRAEWIEKAKEAIRTREEFACEAQRWIADREAAGANARSRRIDSILNRMEEEGWDDVTDRWNRAEKAQFMAHKSVKQNKDLTDRIWKNIKPAIVEMFTSFRSAHLEKLRQDLLERRISQFKLTLKSYCLTLPYDATFAPVGNIVMMDSVQALIHDERLDYIPTDSEFRATFAGVPEMRAKWKERLDEHLCELLSSQQAKDLEAGRSSAVTITPDSLHLATSLFNCSDCNWRHLTYKQILNHSHDRVGIWEAGYSKEAILCFIRLGSWPVEPSQFELSSRDQNLVRMFLQACELPESTTTVDELELLDPLVECQYKQVSQTSTIRIYDWRGFLYPDSQYRDINCPPTDIKRLKREDLRKKLLARRDNWNDMTRQNFACKHCYSPIAMYFSSVQAHIGFCHNITIQWGDSMVHYTLYRDHDLQVVQSTMPKDPDPETEAPSQEKIGA